MKNLIFGFALLCGLSSCPVWAQSKADIAASINTLLAPNARGAITAANLQSILTAINNSKLSADQPSFTAPIIAPAITLSGSGSTGDVSGVSAAPNVNAPPGTFASYLAGSSPLQGLNVLRAPGSLLPGILSVQTPSGTTGGPAQLNRIVINGGDINTGGNGNLFGFIEGLVVEHHYPGPLGSTGNWSGGVNSFSVYSFRDKPTPAGNNNGNFVAGTFTSEAVTTDGGTNFTGPLNFGGPTGLIWQGSGPKGAHFGINAQAGMQEDATNMFNVTGAEFNVYSHVTNAILSTTAGSTAATYTSASGKVAQGQVVYADTTQVPLNATLATVALGSNGTGSVTLSTAALKTSTQAVQFRPSVYYKSIIQLTNRGDDYVNGAVVDAMLSMSGQGPAKFAAGILIGDQNGAYPIAQGGSILQTRGAGTILNVIDTSSYAVTGSLVKGQKTNLADGFLQLTGLNSGIDVGGVGTGAGIGFIDFHSSGAGTDYDARIFANGGAAGSDGTATLNLIAAQIKIPTIPTTGGTVKGTVCIDAAGLLYVKTTTGACL